jgi:hypothetical protein
MMKLHFETHIDWTGDSSPCFQAALAAMNARLALPKGTRLESGGLSARLYEPPAPGSRCRSGFLVRGVRKVGAVHDAVLVSWALEGPDGRLCGCSWDLHLESPGKPLELVLWSEEARRPMPLPEALKATLRALAKEASAPRPRAGRLVGEAPFRALAMAPDGRLAATIDTKAVLWIWDLSTGAPLAHTKAGRSPMRPPEAIAFSPDGSRLVTGAKELVVYDARTAKPLVKLAGHPKGHVSALAWSADGSRIASSSALYVAGADNSVALWDAVRGRRVALWKRSLPANVAFTPGADKLTFTSMDEEENVLVRINLSTGKVSERSLGYSRPFRTTRFSGGLALSQDRPGITLLNDALAERGALALRGWRPPFHIAAGTDGRKLIVGEHVGQRLALVDAVSKRLKNLVVPRIKGLADATINGVAASSDGSRFAAIAGYALALFDGTGTLLLPPEP